MRSSESDVSVTLDESTITNLCNEVGKKLKCIGNLDIDILADGTGCLFVLELNARFGGGYPFTHLAGVGFPQALIQMTRGERVSQKYLNYSIGVKGLKFIEPRNVFK